MRKLFTWAAARLVAAFALALPLAADASPLLLAAANALEKENPVTGESETYDYNYVGSGDWTSADWEDAEGELLAAAPGTENSNLWGAMLVDSDDDISVDKLDGWALQLGVFGGANVTVGELGYWTGSESCFAAVDASSTLTISSTTGKNWNNTVKFYVASEDGITFSSAFAPGNPNGTGKIEYYLTGDGSVTYEDSLGGGVNHVIKAADVELSGDEKSVLSMPLVWFDSTDKTFTADATIKIKNSNGDDIKTVYLTSVTADATTLTAENDVGACELVQTSNGVVLYYVDGDPADVPVEEKTYKPSININFTNGAANGLTTGADVGLTGYEVPGTSWNNYVVANSTFSTVNAVDSTGAASAMSGVSVTISGTRGSHSCGNLTPSSNPLHGYIDENAGNATPTVTVTGIPYYKYRVLVYHSTDTANVPFGYDTINGTDYTYVEDALSEGSTAWGNSGPQNGANAIAEGGNVLVTEALSGSTLTVVGHRAGGNSSARGCIAAIQIIEVKADVGENDLEIAVDGETEYTVTAEDAEKTGTVYLTGLGTLTLAGENKISAATIEISEGVTLVVNADRLDATTFTGAGTVVYDGVVPPTGKGWTDSAWTGTVWLKNKSDITGNNNAATGVQPNSLGNANSKVKFSGVSGWIEAPVVFNPEIILENAGYDYALRLTNGNSPNSTETNRCTVVKKLSGSGTLCCGGTSTAVPTLKVYDAAGFTGSINTVNADDASKTGLVVVFCDESTNLPDTLVNMFINSGLKRTVYVASGKTVTLDSAATWTAATGFVVEGTLNANGALASSHATKAVSGAGTVVFTGRAPTVSGDAWWKNADWTGTVQVKSVDNMVGSGSGTILAFNDYGNEGSTLELNGCTGWLPGPYECTVPLKITGTLNINNGLSDRDHIFTINHLKGNGTIYGGSTADKVIIRVKEWSEFTGLIQLDKKIVVFGEDEMPVKADLTAGQIIVSAGAVVTATNSTANGWWATGGIKVNGELRSPDLTRFGGGTSITTTDNGVFTFITNSNADDMNVDYARLQGTGTLRLEGTAYRCISTNNFPTAMTVDNRLTAGYLHRISGLEITIGSLAGDGYLRSDWGGSAGDRSLKVLQSKDTTWSGKFWTTNPHRLGSLIVAPGANTAGTLTLSATHEAAESTGLSVESGAAVNLTGTWVGATTVAGTFGGTGTLTGDLTFSDGATFKAFAADDADGLVVSGAVTCPADGTVTVDVSAIEPETDVALLKATGLDSDKFALAAGAPEGYSLEVVEGVLTLKVPHVTITVPAVANTTVIVKIGDETIGTASGDYNVAPDSVVTVTYAAVDGYEISGTTEYTIDTSNSETTFDPAGTTEVKQYVAYVVFQQEQEYDSSYYDVTNYYTTVAAAIDAAKAMKKMVVLIAQPEATDTYNISAGETVKVKKGEFTFDGIIFPEGPEYNNTTNVYGEVTQYKCAVNTATIQYPGEDPQGVTTPLAMILNGLYTGYSPSLAGTVVTVLDGSDATLGDVMPEVFTYDSEAHTYTLKAMVASYTDGYATTYYPTLSNAVANVVAGGIIKVIADNTLTGSTTEDAIAVTKNLTLDLNGYTVTGAAGDVPMFNVGAVSFTITDTSEGKTGKAVSAGSKVILSGSACTITLTAGTLESGDVPVYLYDNLNSVLNINGGKIVCSKTSGYAVSILNGTVNMTAGEVNSTCSGFYMHNATVSGGTIKIGSGSSWKVFYDHDNWTTTTVTGGTFNRDVSQYVSSGYEIVNNGDGTYTVRADNGWMYAAPGCWDYTGTWSEGATLGADKVTISDGATYSNRTASAGQLVTLDMTLSFDDANDSEEGYEDAKAAIRLGTGEAEGTYVFQLYTSESSTPTWKNATGFTPEKETDYNIVFVLDLTNKTYTASVVTGAGATTNALSVGGSTTIAFANQNNATPVQQIEFVGAGTVSSIEGSYEDAPAPVDEFVNGQEIGSVTLDTVQATWLNDQNNYAELRTKIESMSQAAFNAAYLLNLNILDENYGDNAYSFAVTGIAVSETAVTVNVKLTRECPIAAGAINGTLKLKGGASLPANTFNVLGSTTIDDAKFADGEEAECVFTKGEGGEKFFLPVIE